MTSNKGFIAFFCLLLALELICSHFASLQPYRIITKPLLVLSLIIFFLLRAKHLDGISKSLTLLALICSLTGDILLLFVEHTSSFFLAGLVAFLLAHILYISTFLKRRNPYKKPYLLYALLASYAILIFLLLKNHLGDFMVPVAIYMGVILVMAVTSFLRIKQVSASSFLLVFLGAIFFLISDSILAINKFYTPLAMSHLSIMFTYATAQLFIVLGLIKQR
ncbi:lysoplasmalogenase [Mangrovimonas sp. ST2L15]|uniref:lysoplasmalogenase n=1 Tax=Mangrovimonas sp. ST2L15 TaxID=1645916 RepID=UPI0006B51983|nr:lysoplasmalogenase [Mangrovimonas sp. ST2L15]